MRRLTRHLTRQLRLPAAATLLATFALASSACTSYRFRDEAELYPAQFHSVSVDIAGNRTFWAGAEYDLTEAVAKEISHRTPYVVMGGTRTDSRLKLTITDVRQNLISRRAFGAPQEMEYVMTVDMEWQDAVTGLPLRSLKGLSAPGRYIPALGAHETYQVAQRAAAERLARDIVDAMREEW